MKPISTLTKITGFTAFLLSSAALTAHAQDAEDEEEVRGWGVQCVSQSRQTEPTCQIEQRVILKETGQSVASVIIRTQSGAATPNLTIKLPLGMLLPSGATIQVDEGYTQSFDVRYCDQQGCYVNAVASGDLLNAMRAGGTMTVRIQTINQDSLEIPVPLTGFSDSLNKIL